MKQYEYKIVVKKYGGVVVKASTLEEKMNERLAEAVAELGPEGWELISISSPFGEFFTATFKREII